MKVSDKLKMISPDNVDQCSSLDTGSDIHHQHPEHTHHHCDTPLPRTLSRHSPGCWLLVSRCSLAEGNWPH